MLDILCFGRPLAIALHVDATLAAHTVRPERGKSARATWRTSNLMT